MWESLFRETGPSRGRDEGTGGSDVSVPHPLFERDSGRSHHAWSAGLVGPASGRVASVPTVFSASAEGVPLRKTAGP